MRIARSTGHSRPSPILKGGQVASSGARKGRAMLRHICRVAILLLAAACNAAFADAVFPDSSFTLADYLFSAPFTSPAGVTLSISQCPSCGNGGTALEIIVNVPDTGTGGILVVNSTFGYNPATDGAIQSISAQVDKNLLEAADTVLELITNNPLPPSKNAPCG